MLISRSSSLLALAFLLTACGGEGMLAPDAGVALPVDATVSDASAPTPDAGADAGMTARDAGSMEPTSCPPPPECAVPLPDPGPEASWRHSIATRLTIAQGSARHRGRDLVLSESDEQWVIGKFAYGAADKDLTDEEVEIFLLRGCSGDWERLGRAITTENDTGHPTVERIEDDGGRIYFRIPEAMRLGVGRHRIHMVVRGDHSDADAYIQIVDGSERFVVSDVDGTLTEAELAEVWTTLLNGPSPDANASAPEALWALADAGYQLYYLTARPDWLTARTHQWVRERGFPPGIVHTTLGGTPLTGDSAISFKRIDLEELSARLGRRPDFAIGNTDTDAAAFATVGVDATRRYFYQLDEDAMGGVHFDDYADLLTPFMALPLVCR